MNITEDYLRNYDDEIYTDDKFIQFHKNEKTHNIVFNTIERDLTHESMSNFRLKFDANATERTLNYPWTGLSTPGNVTVLGMVTPK